MPPRLAYLFQHRYGTWVVFGLRIKLLSSPRQVYCKLSSCPSSRQFSCPSACPSASHRLTVKKLGSRGLHILARILETLFGITIRYHTRVTHYKTLAVHTTNVVTGNHLGMGLAHIFFIFLATITQVISDLKPHWTSVILLRESRDGQDLSQVTRPHP